MQAQNQFTPIFGQGREFDEPLPEKEDALCGIALAVDESTLRHAMTGPVHELFAELAAKATGERPAVTVVRHVHGRVNHVSLTSRHCTEPSEQMPGPRSTQRGTGQWNVQERACCSR